MNALIEQMRRELPAILSRKEASRACGGLISVGTLANRDSQGSGPKGRIRLGKKTAYERDAFLDWLLSNLGEHKITKYSRKNAKRGVKSDD
jgi:hypothetical protein